MPTRGFQKASGISVSRIRSRALAASLTWSAISSSLFTRCIMSSRSCGAIVSFVSSSKIILRSSSISCSIFERWVMLVLASSLLFFAAATTAFSSSATVSIARVICLSANSKTLDFRLLASHFSIFLPFLRIIPLCI